MTWMLNSAPTRFFSPAQPALVGARRCGTLAAVPGRQSAKMTTVAACWQTSVKLGIPSSRWNLKPPEVVGPHALSTQSCGNLELERIPALQLVLLLFGHPPHQRFIISAPETFGTEQHHVTTNSTLNSD